VELEKTEPRAGLFAFLLGLSRKPWVCVSAAALGLLIGLNFKELAAMLAPVGEIYMKLLTLTVTPIIFCALVTGISQLLGSGDGKKYIRRTLATLACGTLIAGFLGTFAAISAAPFLNPDAEKREFIGHALANLEKKASSLDHVQPGVWGFIKNFVPENAVDTLASENLLSVVFMAILLGAALSEVKHRPKETAAGLFAAVYEMFLCILDWVLAFLPLGLCCLLADQASEVGPDAIRAMSAIVIVYLACFLLMAVLYAAVLLRATGKTPKELWRTLKEPFTVAFVASSDSALPMTMEKMADLGYPKEMLNSAIPLSAVLNRHGTAIVFAITTVFVAQIYGVQLTAWNCLLIALSCSLVGAFDSGEYVTIAPMITYVLVPMDLPPAAGVAIILTIWPIFEWFPELQCIMASCANATIVGNIEKTGDEQPTENPSEPVASCP